MIFNVKVSLDGDQWCALIGDNLQDGVAGFGHDPSAAFSGLLDEIKISGNETLAPLAEGMLGPFSHAIVSGKDCGHQYQSGGVIQPRQVRRC